MKRIWNSIVSWFEHGDLVPLLVIVSAVHYAVVLAGKDSWPVAVAIGILVDLGHYRLVRSAVRYAGANRREFIARWTFTAIMTVVSLAYHQRYYSDWWLSAPLPFLIASLAWLQRVDRQLVTKSHDDNRPIIVETPVVLDVSKMSIPEIMTAQSVSRSTAYRIKSRKNGHSKKVVVQ